MLSIDTGRLQILLSSLSKVSTNSLHKHLQCQLFYTHSFSHRQKIQSLLKYEQEVSRQLSQMKQFIKTTLYEYETLETKLQKQLEVIPKSNVKKADFQNINVDTLGIDFDVSHNISISQDPKSYLTEGIIGSLHTTFYGLRYHTQHYGKYVKGKAQLAFGSGNIDTSAKLILFNDEKFDPELQLSLVGKAALTSLTSSLSIGNSYVKAEVKEDIGIGVVYGEATAVFNKEEVTMKAEVGAAAVKGEVSGGITLFGLHITLSGSAEVGAIGAGIEFSSKEKEFTFGGNASFIAGLGFKIHVQYD